MHGEGSKEREERAAEALIAAAMRQEIDEVQLDPESLPRLSRLEKAAMAALGGDFVARLLAGDSLRTKTSSIQRPSAQAGQPCAAGEAQRGLNRADGLDDIAAAEIERKRCEILERKRLDQAGG